MKKLFIIMICFVFITDIYAQEANKQQNRKYKDFERLDYSEPVHSLGLAANVGVPLTYNVENQIGMVFPISDLVFTPELIIQYNCILKKNFGFSIDIPFGLYQRNCSFDFTEYGGENKYYQIGSLYIGFIPKLSYLKKIGKRVDMYVDVGLKFMPFLYDADFFEPDPESLLIITDEDGNILNYDLCDPEVPQKYYFVPDANLSLLFAIHGKNPHHNFIVGITGNLSFVERMYFKYDSTNDYSIPQSGWCSGHIGWNSSSIGITIGYRFMGLRP